MVGENDRRKLSSYQIIELWHTKIQTKAGCL